MVTQKEPARLPGAMMAVERPSRERLYQRTFLHVDRLLLTRNLNWRERAVKGTRHTLGETDAQSRDARSPSPPQKRAGRESGRQLRHNIAQRGAKLLILFRSNRNLRLPYDTHQYKYRNLIERQLCRLKHLRRIATRYEKLAQHFASSIALVSTFVWLT